MMRHLRTIALLVVLTVLATSCERMSVGPEIAGELGQGRAYAAALAARARAAPPASITPATAIALGYLERQRLSLGSPFRLIDYLLRDARLPDSTRRAVAWALLARTLDGDGGAVDPAALDSLGAPGIGGAVNDGAAHLHLIERAVRATSDPRAGELAVRLGYQLARAERELGPEAPGLAARAAALVRDRALAAEDARDLLQQAWRDDLDPLAMIPAWRTARRFRVEQPAMATLPPDAELQAMELVPAVASQLRDLAAAADAPPPAHPDSSLLPLAAAERLATLADAAPTPPEAPVVVPLMTYRAELVRDATLDHWQRRMRHALATRATTEETLAARHAVVDAEAPGTAPARATLAVAVALRTYAQETPWLPGDPGPDDTELADRFGIARVTFDHDVPNAWRPYYRAMLASALDDLELVLPSLDLTGVRVHIGDDVMHGAALALHDPKQRVIYLPVATAAGTIAHEVAHDIDWQAALARYSVRGDYATDRAVRDARGSQLAASMRGLTAASLASSTARGSAHAPSARPTEVFARSVDWFVASALARDGRVDGYLSSAQDDRLTGYALGAPPDLAGTSVPALVRVLDEVAPPDPALRDWYLTRYGPGRTLGPADLVRRVLEAPLDSVAEGSSLVDLVAPVRRVRDAALAQLDAARCRPGAMSDDRVAAARRRLVLLAASARAAGIMRERGTVLAIAEARRWLSVAPYVAAEPLVIAGALSTSGEIAAAEQAVARDSIPAAHATPLAADRCPLEPGGAP